MNSLKSLYGQKEIIAFSITEEFNKIDLYIQLPPNFECCHYFKSKITQKTISNSNTHLTYHGSAKGKKQSGEIHLKINDINTHLGKSNFLEAPLAYSDDLEKYPLPICRFELSDFIEEIIPRKPIKNYFQIYDTDMYRNTLDIYLSKNGFIEKLLNGTLGVPEISYSMFTHTNLEVFKTGEIIRRRDSQPQVYVIQTKKYELIIFNMQEAQNARYLCNKLIYFHSRDYLKTLFDRNAQKVGNGYFIDLKKGLPNKGGGFFNILDTI
ncbi:MAG: hypothetical protein WCZ90_09205 [Melioribacteraceae bacterium]